MEKRVQSKNFAGWEARGLRSAADQLGRKRLRQKSLDRGHCDRRIARADLGKKIEHQCVVGAGRTMDRVYFRPARTNQGHHRGEETTLRYFRGRGRSAANYQD